MASPAAGTRRNGSAFAPFEEARRLFKLANELETLHHKDLFPDALKAFVAFVDAHQKELRDRGNEIAPDLDRSAMAFFRMSQAVPALRAIDLGLTLAPDVPSLLHHKAVVLLSQSGSPEPALALVDRAIELRPHDKAIWATKGEVLRALNRTDEAADAYLRAQQLDATSMQYVERALKLTPNNPVALRMKLRLAKAHGGDSQALEACDALLKVSPNDPELLLARAELLRSLGQLGPALETLERARLLKPGDPGLTFQQGRILLRLGRENEAAERFESLLAQKAPLDANALHEIADAAEARGTNLTLAVSARQRLHELEPRNLENLGALRSLSVRTRNPDLGIAACRAVIEISPQNLEAMRGLAEFLLSADRVEEGFEAFRALIQAHPNAIPDMRRALEAAKHLDQPPMVKEFAQAILRENPHDAGALDELAHAQMGAGERPEALKILDNLIRERPNDIGPLIEKKQLLVDLGQLEDLPKVYDDLFRLDPTRSDIALERGELYLQRALNQAHGDADREAAARAALISFERASLDPALVDRSLVGLAGASRLIHDPERAIRAYRDLLAHPGNDRDADLWKELGHTLREVERLTEAEEAYEQAIQLGREDSDLFWGQANVLAALNQDDRALHLVELLLQREPQNPLFLRRKGQLLMSLGKPQEGLATLKSAVQGSHGDPHVHFEVARALRAHGSYADAVTYYRQGLQVDSNSRIGRLGLAETLQLAGQYNEVVPIVDTLLKEDPNDLAAWQCRADAYRSLGRPQEVLYSLKAVLLLDPNNSAGLMEKYRLHLQHGESAEAFESLDQLLKGEGPEAQNAPLLLQHGDLAGQLGKVEEANRSYERAAQLDPAHLSDIAVRRARVRLGAGRPDLALEILDTTLAQAPAGTERSTSVLLLRAEILNALERPTEAHQVFQDVVTRDPKSEAALAGVARSLLDQGHHAEAKEFLRSAIPGVPPNASLFLMLAEAESGLGSIPDAIGAVLHGVEQLPKSAELWSRLGELYIARESWAEASNALAHGIALDPSNPNLLLRAGFVAEKLGHPNEAFSLYDHATQVAPQNKNAWTSRGLSLLSLSRAEEGQASFERALALDPEFEPAKEGKKASLQKAREIQIDKVGREALLLEARLRRSVTKNDLFVTLHVPFDLLDPVLAVLSRTPKIEIESLSETELKDLEGASYRFITAALERRPEGIERRGFTLADVAVLSPPNYSLLQIQRLFGYVKAVLEADLRPENLRLAPDVEELVRKAFTLIPDNERTLFQIVRTLKVGIFKARLIKVVESAGTAVHAPLPALDLGEYASEFQGASAEENRGEAFFQPENVPAAPLHPGGRPATTTYPGQSSTGPNRSLSDRDPALTIAPLEGAPRCAGCGGIASVQHECGTPLCQHCIAQFHTCPKCGRVVTPSSSEPVGVTFPSHRAHPPALGKVPGFSIRSVLGKGKAPKPEPVVAKSARMSDRLESRVPDHTKAPEHHKTAIPPPPASPPVVKHPVDPTADAKLPPRPAHGREKTDDEPRL